MLVNSSDGELVVKAEELMIIVKHVAVSFLGGDKVIRELEKPRRLGARYYNIGWATRGGRNNV